jgi:hypothetical protein
MMVLLALTTTLLVAAVATIASFLIGYFNETCYVMSKGDGYVLVALIPVWARAGQYLMMVAFTAAIIWLLWPVTVGIEGGGAIFLIAPFAAMAVQIQALNRVVRLAAELSVAHLPVEDIPVFDDVVEPWTAHITYW